MKFRDAILWPLSLPYEMAARLHARAYRSGFFPQRKLDAFVISVGNLTVGGTGKTPMVLWIAQRLAAEGNSVGILTRGYRGETPSGNETNSAGDGDLDTTSDEVQLLKARLGDSVAFGVGPDRFANGANLVVHGVKHFVLDDGFQHRRLARDVDIVLIDATNPFGGGHLLPAGRLREPRSALARADIIVITRGDHAPAVEAAIRQDSDAPIFYAHTQLESIRRLEDDSPADIAAIRSQQLFAFCGIGNPRAFLDDLRQWGFHLAGQRFYPDHHRYSPADALSIESEARNANAAALICTEKDVFNLRNVHWNALPVYFCRIALQINRPDAFWAAIKSHSPTLK